MIDEIIESFENCKHKIWIKPSNVFLLHQIPNTELDYDSDPNNQDEKTSHVHKGRVVTIDNAKSTILLKNADTNNYILCDPAKNQNQTFYQQTTIIIFVYDK